MKSPLDRKELGRRGEELACRYLKQQGYLILETNWSCRYGEIDVIARQGDAFIFIEVRVKKQNSMYGTAQESVNWKKQQQVRKTAIHYLHQHHRHDQPVRFDVFAINYTTKQYTYEHITGAF